MSQLILELCFEQNKSHSEIASTLGMYRTTVIGILKKYQETETIVSLKRCGERPKKLEPVHGSRLLEVLEADCTRTHQELADIISISLILLYALKWLIGP